MDPEDLAYLKLLHGQRSKAKKSKDKKKNAVNDEDVDEYETKVLERHNKLLDDEETKKSTKVLLPIRYSEDLNNELLLVCNSIDSLLRCSMTWYWAFK